MININIISSDTNISKYIKNTVAGLINLEECGIESFQDFELAKENMDLENASLLFIDTDLTGWMAYGKSVNESFPNVHIIYVGSSLDDGYKVYGTEHDAFVYKLQLTPYLNDAVKKVLPKLIDEDKKYVRINWKNAIYVVCDKDILFFERDKRKTLIHMVTGETYTTYAHIDDFVEHVGVEFKRVHFSYLVNFKYVREYHRNNIVLENEVFVPVSRKYSKDVRLYFENLD